MKALKKIMALVICLATLGMMAACTVSLEKIEVTHAPAKTQYFVGQKFDPTGMVVTATYSDETTEAVTEFTYEPAGELTVSDTVITITYEGMTTTQKIRVSEKEITSVEVTSQPTKTEYVAGEKFDATGLKVTAHYNDGSSVETTDYTVKPVRALNENDRNVFVTCGETTLEIPVTVAENPDAYDRIQVYKAIGNVEISGEKATIAFTFYNDYTVRGLLESGMGAMIDNMLGNYIDLPGVWEKNGEESYMVLNSFTFDPSTLKGLAGFVPDDMKDMFNTLIEMDPIDITGCTCPLNIAADNTITFDATLSAMGFSAGVKGSGKGAPASISVKAGEAVEAELGDYSKMKSSSASSAILKDNNNASGGYMLQYCSVAGNTWKLTVNSDKEVKGATVNLNLVAYKKGYDLSDFITLKVNGKEVEISGDLGASISKFTNYPITLDLNKGENTIEIIWKTNPVDANGKEQKITNFKFDYLTFSTDVTILNPSFVG